MVSLIYWHRRLQKLAQPHTWKGARSFYHIRANTHRSKQEKVRPSTFSHQQVLTLPLQLRFRWRWGRRGWSSYCTLHTEQIPMLLPLVQHLDVKPVTPASSLNIMAFWQNWVTYHEWWDVTGEELDNVAPATWPCSSLLQNAALNSPGALAMKSMRGTQKSQYPRSHNTLLILCIDKSEG